MNSITSRCTVSVMQAPLVSKYSDRCIPHMICGQTYLSQRHSISEASHVAI